MCIRDRFNGQQLNTFAPCSPLAPWSLPDPVSLGPEPSKLDLGIIDSRQQVRQVTFSHADKSSRVGHRHQLRRTRFLVWIAGGENVMRNTTFNINSKVLHVILPRQVRSTRLHTSSTMMYRRFHTKYSNLERLAPFFADMVSMGKVPLFGRIYAGSG